MLDAALAGAIGLTQPSTEYLPPEYFMQAGAVGAVPADPNLPRYEGIVTSFAQDTAWGFIQCPELSAFFGKDVFFHQNECGGAIMAKGQKVTFLLREDSPATGKPQAYSVQPKSTAPDPLHAPRYTGTVMSFSLQSAWGFIQCPQLSAVFMKDIFFHVKDCGGVQMAKGQQVTFFLAEDSPAGKPQARCVQLVDPLGGVDGQNRPPPGPPPVQGSRHSGTVTSYSLQSAWGFISCPPLSQYFGKDVFFHHKDCNGQPIQKGMTVNFELDMSDEKRPQGRQIVVEGVPQQQQTVATPAIDMSQVPAGTLQGKIQSFSLQAGWGFIECPMITTSPGKGIFFHIKDAIGFKDGNFQRGAPVQFVVGQGPSGKLQAQQVHPIGPPVETVGMPSMQSGTKRPADVVVDATAMHTQQHLMAMANHNLQALSMVPNDPAKRPRSANDDTGFTLL